MSNYQVLFNGVTVEDRDVEGVERAVAGELGIPHSKAKRLFNGRTVVLASQLSRDEALDLQARLERVGAVARIKDLSLRDEVPLDYERNKSDGTLRDLTAAHVDCPRCGHMQLESTHCAKCGVDIEALFRKRRKEDLLMEKKLRDHRAAVAKNADKQVAAQRGADGEGSDLAASGAEAKRSGTAKAGLFARLFKRSA